MNTNRRESKPQNKSVFPTREWHKPDMASRSLGHRAPLLWLVLPFATGLALGKCGWQLTPIIGLIFAAGCVMIALIGAGRSPRLWAAAIIVATGLAGVVGYTLHRDRLPAWETLPPREAQLTLKITRNFNTRYENHTSGIATITGTEPHLADLRGQRVYYSLHLDDAISPPVPSAEIAALGILERLPEHPAPNSFEGYLADAGINFKLTRGSMQTEIQPPTAFRAFCNHTSDRFSTLLHRGVIDKRPALAGILSAMLLGRKSDLNEQQDTLFMQSGTMHLFAISGLHIGVIALALHALLLLVRLPRTLRFAISLTALWLYVSITGNTPSAVRAFTMVALFQAAYLFRVPGNALSALTASALLVLCFDPLQLFSASFQMSYGIVGALLMLGLPIGESMTERWPVFAQLPAATWTWWQRGIDWGRRKFLAALGISLAAILFSMLAGVEYFGLFTPGALLANLILIPLASFVILAGMASLLCGLIGFTVGNILCNHAAVLMLWGIENGIRQFVSWPGIYHEAVFKAAWIGPAALAILFASILYGYATGWAVKRGRWWPPFAIVAVVLIFGVNFV